MTRGGEAPVRVEHHEGWGALVLSRPERRNALTGPMVSALQEGLAELVAGGAKAILMRGEGGAFCSGIDLQAFAGQPEPPWRASFDAEWAGFHRQLYACPATLVCALERFAINAGASLALASDLLVVGEGAYLMIGEASIGMHAPMNVAWLRLRTNAAVAAQLALGAERASAADLFRLGLAYRVAADAQVRAEAEAIAARLAGYPGAGLAAIKRGLRAPVPEGADVFAAVANTGQPTAPPARVPG